MVIGPIAAVEICVLCLLCIRQRKNQDAAKQQIRKENEIEDKPQLHGESRMIYELALSLRRIPEILGFQKPRNELPVVERDVFELQSERMAVEVPAVEPVGSELVAEMKTADV